MFDLQTRDALDFLSGLATGSVDLVVTDPAYESLEKHRKIGTTTRLQDWFPIFPNRLFPRLFAEFYRVMRPNAHLYVMCDSETLFFMRPIAQEHGLRFWKPLVWDKQKIGMGYHYRAQLEFIAFFEKGKRKLNDLGVPDLLSYPRVRGGYPTEKPVELLETLIRQSSEPGDLVVDPFLGSGATGVAALQLGRRFAGCDIEERAIELAQQRCSALGR
jgi:site-specific DNA-methyltransferase (adenine-specific)